jgi:hypothetical protein
MKEELVNLIPKSFTKCTHTHTYTHAPHQTVGGPVLKTEVN